MNDVKLKLEAIEKELKTQLEVLRNARTPTQKRQAKQKAMNLLKKKKMYEGHLNTLSSTQMTVDTASVETQIMKDNVGVMRAMKDTVNVQKDMMKECNVDSMYDVMDDMAEMKDDQAEISEAFNRNYDVEVGDDELEAGNKRYVIIL
jgi:charged multivesicular body protein 5